MAQSIKTSKFGTLDTSGRVPFYLTGEDTDPLKATLGATFTINGKEYGFIPEDRITKGAASGNFGQVLVGFLDPQLLYEFKNNSDYVDLANTQFGNFDVGNYISKELGASTKGYIAPIENFSSVLNAGKAQYDPTLTGEIKGIGNYQGQSVFYGNNGYVEPSGKYNYRQTIGQQIIGYTYSDGGGLLAGLGREILKAGPALPIALDIIGASFGLPGIGTAVAGGVTAGAIASGDEKTATNYAAQTIAGQLGIGSSVADATGSTIVGQMVQATTGNLLAGQNPEDAVTNAAKSTAVSQAAGAVAENQAEKYIENLPIPDYLSAGPAPTSADTIAAFPELAPQTYSPDFVGPLRPGDIIDSTLTNITTPPAGTVEGINATLPTTMVTDIPVDYSLAPATKAVTVDDVVKNIVLDNLDTSLQTGNLTADQVDTALNTLTGGYTLGGTTEGIKATLPDTVVTGTEPVDYTLNVLTGGEGLKLPTSSNLETMGGGQGLTANVDGGVLSETGVTKTGDVILGDPNSFINTTLPLSTDTIDTSTKTAETTNTPLTKEQIEAMIKLAVTLALADQAKKVITDATTSGNNDTTVTGNPYIPSNISGWERPTYTQTFKGPIDLNSIFTTNNLLGGTQWAGLQGNQFANIPQVSMSDFISSIQNGKV
jgi:hypothetical protein